MVSDSHLGDYHFPPLQSSSPSPRSHDQDLNLSSPHRCPGGVPSKPPPRRSSARVEPATSLKSPISLKPSPRWPPVLPFLPINVGAQCTPSPTPPSTVASLALKSSQSVQSSCSSATSITSDPPPYSSRPESSDCPPAAPRLRSKPSFSGSWSVDEETLLPTDGDSKYWPFSDQSSLLEYSGLPMTPMTDRCGPVDIAKPNGPKPITRVSVPETGDCSSESDRIGTGNTPPIDSDPGQHGLVPCGLDGSGPIWDWLDGLSLEAAVAVDADAHANVAQLQSMGGKRKCDVGDDASCGPVPGKGCKRLRV